MSRLGGARVATLALLAVALIGFWQATRLESWSFDGPGAGFFPQLVAIVCIGLSLVVFIVPGRAGMTEDGDTDEPADTATADGRRTFAIYALSFVVLAIGATYVGFVVTTIAIAILIVRFAERRSWTAALVYGVACALIGLVCFGWLLRVDLPQTAIEQTFFALVR